MMSGIYIPGMEMQENCFECPLNKDDGFGYFNCGVTKNECDWLKLPDDCPLIPVPDHGGLFDVGQFEKGCFYGYGHDGKVYKLLWDTKIFDGAKKFYINPIIPADVEGEGC